MNAGMNMVVARPLPVVVLISSLLPSFAVAQPDAVHHRGDLSSADRWTLNAEPILTIGTDEGAEPYMLFRVHSGLVLGDGSLAIANGGSNEVRLFDSEGSYIETWGGSGEGPGEFNSIFGMIQLGGDTVGVTDGRLHRFSLFVPDAGFVSSFGLPVNPDLIAAVPLARFEDGSYVLRSGAYAVGADGPTQVERDDVNYFRWWPGTDSLKVEATLPGIEFLIAPSGGVRSDGVKVIGRTPRPFGSFTVVAGNTTKWCDAEASVFRVECFSTADRGSEVFSVDAEARRVTPEDVERWNDSGLARLEDRSDSQRRLRQAQSEYPDPPEFMPVIGHGLRIGHDGTLWVKLYVPQGSVVDAVTWVVFYSTGDELAIIDIPLGMRVLDASGDYVLGVVRDDLDIERVVLHSILRSG